MSRGVAASGVVQTLWAELVAATLADAGVALVVLSPGSRSTPLAAAFAAEPRLELVTIIDERAAAFYALGAARASGVPAALACTSGSAAAHYLPAIVEASAAAVPLVVLTADRPPELHACGANQTIDQVKMYGAFARGALDLGAPEGSELALRAVRRKIAQAVALARGPHPGPVHVEVPLRKPLEPARPANDVERELAALVAGLRAQPVACGAPWLAADAAAVDAVAAAIAAEPRGVIYVGALPVAAGGSGERHAADGGGERHAAGGGGERHAADGGGERHAAGGGGARHAADGSGERHAADGGGARHAADGGGERHAADGSGERHAAGGERHAAGGSGERHAAGGSGERHAAGGSGERHDVSGERTSVRDAVFALAARSGYPIVAETGSGLRCGPRPADVTVVEHGELIAAALAPQLVVQFGAEPLAQIACDARYVLAAYVWQDPDSSARAVVVGDLAHTLARLAVRCPDRGRSRPEPPRGGEWPAQWRAADARAAAALDRAIADHPRNEIAAVRAAIAAAPRAQLQLGNSLPVRIADIAVRGADTPRAVITQRGTSGIDGLVASAAGATRSGAVLLVLGDVSFAHDLGGLLAAREARAPLAIVVIDNAGGRIFDGLPVARSALDAATYARCFTTPPGVDPVAVAVALGARGVRAESPAAIAAAVTAALAQRGATVIHAPVSSTGAHDVTRTTRDYLGAMP